LAEHISKFSAVPAAGRLRQAEAGGARAAPNFLKFRAGGLPKLARPLEKQTISKVVRNADNNTTINLLELLEPISRLFFRRDFLWPARGELFVRHWRSRVTEHISKFSAVLAAGRLRRAEAGGARAAPNFLNFRAGGLPNLARPLEKQTISKVL
jgi:hypothetical protein